jgi:tetratricopeptide (TPR) repeat protein
MLVYLRAFPPLPRGEGGGEGEFDRKAYVAALLLFVCALLSKTVTCSLPAALILILWWKRGRLTRREVLPTLPMFVVGAIAASYTGYLERHHVGASGPEWDLSFVQRCYVAGKALWFYAGKLLLPIRLSFVYSRWDVSRLGVWRAVVPLFAYAAVVGVLFLARRRAGRGPVTAALLFAGTLLPALGFVNVFPMRYTFAADHYQYLASIALLAVVAAVLWRGSRSPMLHSSLFILPLLLVPLTFARCEVFQNREALWRDTLAKEPDSWVAHTNLGHVLVEQKRYGEAFEEYRRAMELRPDLPESHRNFGAALAERGRYGEAIGEYEAALRLEPKYAEAYYGMGRAYALQGKGEDAQKMYREALRIDPTYPQAQYQLGVALERAGRLDDAIAHFRAAIASSPDYAEAHTHLGSAYLRKREFDAAVAEFQAALGIEPNQPEARQGLELATMLRGH